MSVHDYFKYAGAILAALVYISLIRKVWKGLSLNFATFLLWGVLDGIAGLSSLFQKGNWLLPTGYSLASFLVVGLLIYRKQKSEWKWVEAFTIFLVIICMVVWATTTNEVATAASSLAMFIATLPLLKETWQKPKETPLVDYTGFALANFLTIWAGKTWTVEERCYPVLALAATVLTLAAAMRQYLPNFQKSTPA